MVMTAKMTMIIVINLKKKKGIKSKRTNNIILTVFDIIDLQGLFKGKRARKKIIFRLPFIIS